MSNNDIQSIYEMTDAELIDFLTLYEAGEVLSSEEEIEYVINRIPSFFAETGRPVLVNYSWTDSDEEVFAKMKEESIAVGLDLEAGFDEYSDEKFGDK